MQYIICWIVIEPMPRLHDGFTTVDNCRLYLTVPFDGHCKVTDVRLDLTLKAFYPESVSL